MRVLDTKRTSIDITKLITFFNGWKITISLLLKFWDHIPKTPDYVLYTYRFN